MKKLLISLFIIILIVAGLYFWFYKQNTSAPNTPVDNQESGSPFGNPGTATRAPAAGPEGGISTRPVTNGGETQTDSTKTETKLPKLRQLSATPIGGFMASTTASTTIVRYLDRGIGHVYEANSLSNEIPKISNTTIPKVYESYWNKNLTAVVIRYMKESDSIINFSGELRKIKTNASSTDPNALPYEIKGKFISPAIQAVAVSPKGDRIFTFAVNEGKGSGTISAFDESKETNIFTTPFTQAYIDWPEENILAIGTRATGIAPSYFYLVDVKKPYLKKIVGGIGLTAKANGNATKVIYSTTSPKGIATYIYNTKDGSSQEAVFKTLSEKCVWSKINPAEAYCAVPLTYPEGLYPDDWYKGNVSFNDQIWHIDTTTGEVQLIANLFQLSNELIDGTNLTLDPKENFLYFINKRDLTLWSLSL